MYCIEAQNTTAAPLQQHSKHAIGAHCVFTVCSPIWPHCVGVMLSFSHNQRWAVWFKNKTLVIVSATLSLVPAGTSSSWDLAGGKRRFSHTVGLDSTANRSFPPRDCTPISCCIFPPGHTSHSTDLSERHTTGSLTSDGRPVRAPLWSARPQNNRFK